MADNTKTPDFIPIGGKQTSTPDFIPMGGAAAAAPATTPTIPTPTSQEDIYKFFSNQPSPTSLQAFGESARYAKGAFGGAGEAAMGMVKGAAKAASDVGQFAGAPFDPQKSSAVWDDIVGVGKGLYNTVTAPFHWSTYSDPRQFGQETMNLAALLYSPSKTATLPGDIAVTSKLFTPKQQLFIEGSRRLMEGQVEAQHVLATGEKAYRESIGRTADAIAQDDQVRGPGPIDARSIRDAQNQTIAQMDAATRGAQPKAVRAEQLVANAFEQTNGMLTFDRLKRLRTDIGDLYSRNMSPLERMQVTAAYKEATNLLEARAQLLGRGADWTKYNEAWKSYMELRENTLDDLKLTRPDPTEFWGRIRNSKNAVMQNMFEKFDRATNPFNVPGAGAGEKIQQMAKDIDPLYRTMSQGEGGALMGRLRAIMQHPAYGLVGGILGSKAAGFLPGGRWIGGMIGASEGVALANKISMADFLVRGRRFPEGAAAVERGAGGMIPDVPEPTAPLQGPPRGEMPQGNPTPFGNLEGGAEPWDEMERRSPGSTPPTTPAEGFVERRRPLQQAPSSPIDPNKAMTPEYRARMDAGAQRMFGKDYSDLTPDQRGEVARASEKSQRLAAAKAGKMGKK